MISEITFATRASSFWRASTPTSEPFVRQVNDEWATFDHPPIISRSDPARRGLINETAFEAFCILHTRDVHFPDFSPTKDNAVIEEAFSNADNFIHIEKQMGGVSAPPLDAIELSEINQLIRHLQTKFLDALNARTIVFRPRFKGCGIIDSCRGDMTIGERLVEVKAGDRHFRSTDFRQLIVYAALRLREEGKTFLEVELYNPRMGKSFLCTIDELCFEMAGKSAGVLLFEIIECIGSAGDSL